MKVAVMQPYILPYIGYIQLMAAVDRFVFLNDVAYINKGWINRNRILVNGSDYLFTIPLAGASQNRMINEIELVADEKWKTKFLRSVEMAYRKAPHYAEVYPVLKEIIMHHELRLEKYIANSFRVLNRLLGIKTELISSAELGAGEGLKAQDKIIALCRRMDCTMYINPIGGVELYSRDAFAQAGMTLHFLKSENITYQQGNHDFVPWLSVIDVLMFNGAEGTREMLGKYQLV